MAYLQAQVTACMLSCSIAITATVSTAIMNMAWLMSTTREFTENACNETTASAQQQQQVEKEGPGANDI
jgi:hypothetical protein